MRRFFIAVFAASVLATGLAVARMPEQRLPDSHPDPDAASRQEAPKHARGGTLQIRHAMREAVNGGLVGIVSGGMDATDIGKATDLAIGLETNEGGLRPLLIVGKGGFRNVTDIIFARGVDIGIVQSDVLAALKRDPPFPGIENYLQYITRLYNEQIHILAGKEIASIEELASKKVNFGMSDSETRMTAEAIFGGAGYLRRADELSSASCAGEIAARGNFSTGLRRE
jgi:NMT1-like family